MKETVGTPIGLTDARYLMLDCSNAPLTGILYGNTHLDFAGHMALGADASISSTTILDIDETLTTVDDTLYGIFAQLNLEPAGVLSAATHLVAMDMQAQWNSTEDGSVHASIQGIKGEGVSIAVMVGAGDVNELVGVYGKGSNLGISDVTSVIGGLFTATNDDGIGSQLGDVASAYSLLARAYTDKDTGVITDRYGLYIEDITGGGETTNQYGIYCPALVGGDTTNLFIKNISADSDFGSGNIDTTGIGTFGSVAVPTVFTSMTEPTGFVDKVATLSFVDGTRVFTITGAHDIYINGVKTSKTTDSIIIADPGDPPTATLNWIYYNAAGVLSQTTSQPSFALPTIATLYYNTVTNKGLLGEERHGIKMDVDTHSLLHYTVGTRYESGLTGTFGNTTFTITAGQIDDEDLPAVIAEQTTCNVLYKDGSANFKWLEAQTKYYYEDVGSNINYNNGNALTPLGGNQYVAYWIFATNDATTPIVSLMGQRTDANIANARANNTYESLELGTLPYQEMKLLYRVILRNTATPYTETLDLRSISNLPSGTYLASDHGVLSGLTDDDHPQYVLTTGDTMTGTLTVNEAGIEVYPADGVDGLTVIGKQAAYFEQDVLAGYGLYIYRNLAEDHAYGTVTIYNNHASDAGPALALHHGGTGAHIRSEDPNEDLIISTHDAGSIIVKPGTDSTTAFQVNQADNTVVLNVDTINARMGIGTASPGAQLHIGIGSTAAIGQIIRGASGQTANLQEWQDSAGNIDLAINSDGDLFTDRWLAQTTNTFIGVGAAGANTLAHTTGAEGYNNTGIGYNALREITTGKYNFAVGSSALGKNTTGSNNIGIGTNAGYYNVTGIKNTIVGSFAGQGASGQSFSNNSLYGMEAGSLLSTGSNNIFLGANAGDKQTTLWNLLIVDNQTRADVATELTNSILYGVMAAAPADQTLRINAATTVTDKITFTQTDGNEYIDSESDGELDLGATTAINLRSDTVFVGAGTGLPYGSMYTVDAISVTMTDQNTWYEVDEAQAWTTGLLNLCTFTDPYLTVTKAGTYLITWTLSGACDAPDQHIEAGIIIDQTTVQDQGQSHNQVKFADREITYAGSAIITLTANQKISLAVRNITSGADIFTAHVGSLKVVMIGG